MFIDKQKFSQRIISVREAHGFSHASDMSALMGWNSSEWGKLESGDATGSDIPVYVEEINARLSVDREWLMPHTYYKVFVQQASAQTLFNRLHALHKAGWSEERVCEVAGVTHDMIERARRSWKKTGITAFADLGLVDAVMTKTPQLTDYGPDEYVRQNGLRDHARGLRDAGYTLQDDGKTGDGTLAQLVGIGGGLLNKFVNGGSETACVTKRIYDAFMSVPGHIDHRYPSEVGIRRRLESLSAWGYDLDTIARDAGLTSLATTRILSAQTNHICPDRFIGQRIVEAFSKLEHIPGHDEFAKILAEDNGWRLPFQYDIENIDKVQCKTWPRRTNAGVKAIDGSDEYRNNMLRAEFAELCESLGRVA